MTRRLAPKILAATLCLLLGRADTRATAQAPPRPAANPFRQSLQPDLVPPFPRRSFDFGRGAEYHRRIARNQCGLPSGFDFDREIPIVAARTVSFFPPLEDTLRVPGAVDPFALAKAADGLAPATGARTIRRKRFTPQAPNLAIGPFLLRTNGVAIYEDGGIASGGLLSHSGGIEASERGGEAVLRLRAYSAAPLDILSTDAVPLWSTEVPAWVPRGGPTEVSLADPLADPGLRAKVARSFDEVTHIEVTIEPRTIR
ncbi:hypothetical protein [Tautonia plasticadhaerens]|uniref:Secreted protein n=1 Tax=Tautonia plasticadhaerens TaxID=2527974 RepID=A0A518HDX1_9BACT|nr:hypothetical protein [Tautonia plasticadhaerens]QDV39048.1 hypothetical protein ElP_70100 [Tautonia plasticadhaerens]